MTPTFVLLGFKKLEILSYKSYESRDITFLNVTGPNKQKVIYPSKFGPYGCCGREQMGTFAIHDAMQVKVVSSKLMLKTQWKRSISQEKNDKKSAKRM